MRGEHAGSESPAQCVTNQNLQATPEAPWLLWLDGEHGAALNMALDQALLDSAAILPAPVLRIYRWERPAVSFGRSQLKPSDIPADHECVRRPTGGGVVWHGNDLTYSLILPAEHAIAKMEIHESYRLIHSAIGNELGKEFHLQDKRSKGADLRCMRCFESPTRHDILGSDGSKYAGAAQYRGRVGTLTQGSVRLEATGGDWERLRDTIIRSFATFSPSGYTVWRPPEEIFSRAQALVDNQFATEAWNNKGTSATPSDQKNTRHKSPDWLRVKSSAGSRKHVTDILSDLHLNTVCASAHCPNLGKCFSDGTATFLILGNTCTRNCRFCAVGTGGHPAPPDPDEAERLAEAVHRLKLSFVVVTSVTRDDLPDGGAGAFRDAILAIRRKCPGAGVEVLTPDFGGHKEPLMTVLDARPEVFNHNIETVRRLSSAIRSTATYDRSLGVLANAVRLGRGIPVKSGMMLGLGEEDEEVREVFADLRAAGVSLLTIGQYLPPTNDHQPLVRHLTPEEFEAWREEALSFGFVDVMSGPLVRSSYHARELADRAKVSGGRNQTNS